MLYKPVKSKRLVVRKVTVTYRTNPQLTNHPFQRFQTKVAQDWTIYSTNSQMPISLLVAKERLLLTLRHHANEKAAHNSGQEWSLRQAEEQAKNNIKHQYMLGSTVRGREGLTTWTVGESRHARNVLW